MGRGGAVGAFWSEILALPTLVYTAALGVALVYWLIAILLGGLDHDGADAHGAHDAAHGAHDVAHGHDGHVDHHAGDGHDHAHEAGFAPLVALVSALGLRGVPLTFGLSNLALWSWAACFLGMHHLAPRAPGPAWLVSTAIALASLVLGALATRVAVRPFHRVFKTHHAPSKLAFLGRPCTITTASVDATFGQALCEDGGAGLVIAVRYDGPARLTKGQRAVLVDYDPGRDLYIIEPLDPGDPPADERRDPPAPERPRLGAT